MGSATTKLTESHRLDTTSPKRVLLVNPWSTCHGGTTIVALEFVKHVDRNQFELTMLCPDEGELPDRLRELKVPYIIHPLPGWSQKTCLRFIKETFWYIRFLRRERFDVIHLNGSMWRSCMAWAANYCKVPMVVHVHNPVTDAEDNFSLRWAQRILPVSDAVGKSLQGIESYRKKTKTIYNGVELDLFLPEGENNRGEISRANDSLLVGFVGQTVPRKGLLYLIEALPKIVKEVPNARVIVVGCAPPNQDEYEHQCRGRAKELGMADHIEFVGYRRDVNRWMRTFDLFVLPTRAEPFGKVIIEAMATRCTVVASRVGGIPEIIDSPEFGLLVPPENSEALADAVISLLKDGERRKKIAENGCQHARKKFSIEAMINRLQDVYREAIATSN